jgi:formamidopyrimidine-DNA glycosylase
VPELPDVEAARRLIAERALHRRITGVPVADPYVCRPHSHDQLRDALTGRTLTAAQRCGKQMWCETSAVGGSTTPGPELGIHLGMSGEIVVTFADGRPAGGGDPLSDAGAPKRPGWNRFTIEFADGGSLLLYDTRRLGRVRLNPDLSGLGPDAELLTPVEFRRLLSTGRIAVKARLMDQSKMAGIGNLLADEILWQARVSPAARVGSLRRADLDRLHRALQDVLRAAIPAGGLHHSELLPERRSGGRCPRCGAEMKHSTVGGRSTWWCSREQAGKRPRQAASRG